MRMLMQVKVPNEEFNDAVREGQIGDPVLERGCY